MNFKAIRGVLLEKWKNSDKRILAASLVLVFCVVSILSIVFEKDTEEASYEFKSEGINYAMVLQRYSGFDWSEVNTAVHLNWDNGYIHLKNNEAYVKLEAKVYPINFRNKDVEWQSSNEEVAYIDGNGNIMVIAPGEYHFRATLTETGATADAVLKVLQPVTGLFLPTTNVQMTTNDSGRLLTTMVFPENATNTNVLWESDHPEIVSVDENGRIKPEKTGNAIITATTEDGGYQRICHVSVTNPSVEVAEIAIQDPESKTIGAGEALQLTAIPKPSNAKNRTPLKWESSNTSVASVSQTGRVSGINSGTATITVSSTNGVTSSVDVTVISSLNSVIRNDVTSAATGAGGVRYTNYSMTLPMMVRTQMGLSPAPRMWANGGTRAATEAELAEYVNPNEFFTDAYKYQFLDLSQPNGVSAEILDEFLADKGILKGMGSVFIEAAQRYGISEVYLVAHACLESANGTSQLAMGVEYNGETVYNLFGIGAYDSDAVGNGSLRAYELGWTTPEEALLGGAEWIDENYIHSVNGEQNTLYKMRWNPDNPATHQYATDISWAVKQAANIEKIFNDFPEAVLAFDVPVYSGMVPPVIE